MVSPYLTFKNEVSLRALFVFIALLLIVRVTGSFAQAAQGINSISGTELSKGADGKKLTVDCKKDLRKALVQALSDRRVQSKITEVTLKNLQELYKKESPAYGIAVMALTLKNPEEAIPILKQQLNSENPLVVIESAATLALMGSKEGVAELKAVKTSSQSQIEFFYAKAALVLLDEFIPPGLQKQASAFREREELMRQCGTARVRRHRNFRI